MRVKVAFITLTVLAAAALLGGGSAVAMLLPVVALLASAALQWMPGERTLVRLAERARRDSVGRIRSSWRRRLPHAVDLPSPCGRRALLAHGRRGPPASSGALA